MVDFEPVLLKRVGRPDSPSLHTYREDGGYQALHKALHEMSPADVRKAVLDSGVRGRGGAGFPTGVKWGFLPKDYEGQIYLCINGDESEPCTFNNRVLIEEDPHQVLEGIILTCYAVGATKAYFYIRYEYGHGTRIFQKAIDEAYEAGLLGLNIMDKGLDVDCYVHRGAGAYICGEETGLIESLEGKRAWPRIKPPFPAVEGVFRKPTIVNNIETMACVTHIVDRGADWFKSMGTPSENPEKPGWGSYGPKLWNLSGHINKPGTYEAPLGITVREAIEEFGGGVPNGRSVKGVIPGGFSVGFLTGDELDLKLDFDSLQAAGCMGLGTGALTVFDDTTSIVDVVHNICRFFSHESCGQCTPCREGTGWMLQMIDRIRKGQGRREDLDLLAEIGDSIGIMPGTTICGLSDGAGWPVKMAVQKYRDEFESYIKAGEKSSLLSLEVVGH